MNWSDVNPKWPNQKMSLFGAGSDSGTFDYFTEAVTGKAKASRGDFTASEDDNVLVQGIEKDANSLGYIPYAYYEPHAEADEGARHRRRQRLREAFAGSGARPARTTRSAVLCSSMSARSRPTSRRFSSTSSSP